MKQTLLILIFMVLMINIHPLNLNGQWRARSGVSISQLNETQLREAIAWNSKIKTFSGTVALLGFVGSIGGGYAYESLKDLPEDNKLVRICGWVLVSSMLAFSYGSLMYLISAQRKADREIELIKRTGFVAIAPVIRKEFDILTIGFEVGFIF